MRDKTIIEAVANARSRGSKVVANELKAKDGFSVSVVVDRDKKMDYETHNWIIKIIRVPLVLIFNMLPAKWGRKIFTAFCGNQGDSVTIHRWATTYRALETMYTFQLRRSRGETSVIDNFWELFPSNTRAIRNRLALVKRELSNAINEVSKRKSEVHLMSLGSGSGRAIFEVSAQFNESPPIKIELIDISRSAINFSKELAKSYNLNQDQIKWHQDYIQNFRKYCKSRPDIVEMVGILDYLPYEQAVDLTSGIYKILSPSGWLITCNIRPNLEQTFVTKAVNWSMIYRTPQELGNIVIEAGFDPQNVKIIYEPLKIHGLAICQKIA